MRERERKRIEREKGEIIASTAATSYKIMDIVIIC